MKMPITEEWIVKKAAKEGDTDPTTGSVGYIPGFVPSAADRHYNAIISQYHERLAAKDSEMAAANAELFHLRGVIEWCLARDERNSSLPKAYADKLQAALKGE